jgi:hypothetical protein
MTRLQGLHAGDLHSAAALKSEDEAGGRLKNAPAW